MNSHQEFKTLYNIEVEKAYENFLNTVVEMFKEEGLVCKIENSNNSANVSSKNIFLTVNDIPMRMGISSLESRMHFKIELHFRNWTIMLRYCPELAVYGSKRLFPQKYFNSVKEVADYFKEHKILDMVNVKLRNVARVGVFEHLKKYNQF